METVLNFMENIYSDTKTLSYIYIVGSVLLFIFIVLLIFSLRKKENVKDDNKELVDNNEKTEEFNNNEKEEVEIEKEEIKENVINKDNSFDEGNIFEKTTIIPIDNDSEPLESNKEETIEKAIENVLNKEELNNEEELDEKISNDIPDVDEFVENVVKKTYEKNEQFSSVYVNNEEDEKPVIEEETNNIDNDEEKIIEEKNNEVEDNIEEKLSHLKKALDGDEVDVNLKQDNLKEQLDNLKAKKTETISTEDILNKLKSNNEKE